MHRPGMREIMLKHRTRLILFWVTIVLIFAVALALIVTIVRLWNRVYSKEAPVLAIAPTDVTVCAGGTQHFTASSDQVVWEATGGSITEDGLFVAGQMAGDYQVSVRDDRGVRTARANVHVIMCTPTPMPATLTPTRALPTPTPQPSPETVILVEDPQGDVKTYGGGVPAQPIPAGIDIRQASIGPELRVQVGLSENTPAELRGWVQEGELLFWLVTYEPVPEDVYPNWVFALDTDANQETGRAPGSARINPDLGDEAALNLYYDGERGEYVAELLVWSPVQRDWVVAQQTVRFMFSESRTVIGLAVSSTALSQAVAQTANGIVVLDQMRGRAAALSFAGGEAVIDLCPDSPA